MLGTELAPAKIGKRTDLDLLHVVQLDRNMQSRQGR
jgi:hypothetical protein